MDQARHVSVLLNECIENLNIRPDGTYVDGTLGLGGHSYEIASRLTTGRLIGIDRDQTAIERAGKRLSPFRDIVTLVHGNFCDTAAILESLNIDAVDGMLFDLGVSSPQLDEAQRGFSYRVEAPLDMRMDNRNPLSAKEVVNLYSEDRLRQILWQYGEERFSSRIASAIVRARESAPIETTGELVSIIKSAIPAAAREGGHHPAKRSFQAIRIEVNAELDAIEPAIRSAAARLAVGGRIAVITFHSLEDRIVKQTFADLSSGCTCPPDFPVCVCGKKPLLRLVNRKPITATEEELAVNPRARSAKLRIAEKL